MEVIWTVIKINIVPVIGIIYNVMKQKPGFRTVPVMGLEFIPVSTMKMLVLNIRVSIRCVWVVFIKTFRVYSISRS